MKNLEQIQREMQNYILKKDLNILDGIVSPTNMPVIDRLNVYRNGYYGRLVEMLKSDYLVLCQLIGEVEFENMAHHYLDANPSQYFSIRDIGKALPDFLMTQNTVHPAHVEVAAFEWSMNRAKLAVDSDIFTLEALSALALDQWPQLIFVLQPSLCVLTCCYNSIDCWQKIQDGYGSLLFQSLKEPITYIVWRCGENVQYRQLDLCEAALLNLLQSQRNFSDICEALMIYFDSEQSAAQWLAKILQEWIQVGLFCQVK